MSFGQIFSLIVSAVTLFTMFGEVWGMDKKILTAFFLSRPMPYEKEEEERPYPLWIRFGLVISSPEVNQVIPDLLLLGDLFKNLYECCYDKFFVALAELEQSVLVPSRVLGVHARYYVREMQILAYTQLLESHRSLTLDSLARHRLELVLNLSTANSRDSSQPRVYMPGSTE
ncbi:hypothetical protein H1R20_g15121, partial [Candolleomyces eurysporus]